MKTLFYSLLFLSLISTCKDTPPEATVRAEDQISVAVDPVGNSTTAEDEPAGTTPEPSDLPVEPMSTATPDAPLIDPGVSAPEVAVSSTIPAADKKNGNSPNVEINTRTDERPVESDAIESTVTAAPSTATNVTDKPELPAAVTVDHSAWNTQLQRFVNPAGNVNYAAWKQAESQLDDYITQLSINVPTADWTKDEAKAYWLNAYNASTVKLILNNWPVNSITDLHGGKPWDVKWIKLGGKAYSLNQIEHDIIRPRYGDARIHFAVNCAAASCPPLYNRAFLADGLSGTLTQLTRRFINNSRYNSIAADKLELSKIFDWYGEDFGDVRRYVDRYTDTEVSPDAEVEFREYDWALNKQ